MSRVLKLTLAYDGTAYVGWQRQASGESIQGLLERALTRIDDAPVTVAGAGRTDAGVHALGQVASAAVATTLDSATLRRALNAILPPDVRVTQIEHVPDDFHARFSATGKQYDYWIWRGEVQPPFVRLTSWHIPRPLDVRAMDEAAQLLQGQHDFAAFQSSGSSVKTSARTVSLARVLTGDAAWAGSGSRFLQIGETCAGSLVVARIEADGFLRHMVRAVVGTLVEIGDRRRPVESIRALLESGDRADAGATAPPHGLVLVRVNYGPLVAPGSGSL